MHRVSQRLAQDGGNFAGQAEVAPQIGPVRDRLVIDLDDGVGLAAGDGRAGLGVDFENAGSVAVYAQFGAAGEHAIAFDAFDDGLLDDAAVEVGAGGNVGGGEAGAAVGGAADHGLGAIAAGFDYGGHVVRAAGDGSDDEDARRAHAVEIRRVRVDGLALGGLHGDELTELRGGGIDAVNQFGQPVVGKEHSRRLRIVARTADRRRSGGGCRRWRSASWPGGSGPGRRRSRSTAPGRCRSCAARWD